MKRWQALSRNASRKSCRHRHVGQQERRPSASVRRARRRRCRGRARKVWRPARGCGCGIRNRRSSRRCAECAPSAAARGAASSRTQAASEFRHRAAQHRRRLERDAGLVGQQHGVEPTMSRPPQAPGPISRGISLTAAMAPSRSGRKAVGLAADTGQHRIEAGDRLGKGMRLGPDRRAAGAAAGCARRRPAPQPRPKPKAASSRIAIGCRMAAMSGEDCGISAGPGPNLTTPAS